MSIKIFIGYQFHVITGHRFYNRTIEIIEYFWYFDGTEIY